MKIRTTEGSILDPYGVPELHYVLSESGLYLREDFKKYPLALDFFSGCGGMSLGLIKGGFEVIGGFDNDCSAAHTYMVNLGAYPMDIHYTSEKWEKKLADYFEKVFKDKPQKSYPIYSERFSEFIKCVETSGSGWIKREQENGRQTPPVRHFFFGDVREVSGEWILNKLGLNYGELDLVSGSPPCQGFSLAGKRNVADPRNNLVFEFARLVCEMKPKTMIFENVPGIINMLTPEGLPVMDVLCRILEDGGFGTVDALKKSLCASSGAGAAIKGKHDRKSLKATKIKQPEAQASLDF